MTFNEFAKGAVKLATKVYTTVKADAPEVMTAFGVVMVGKALIDTANAAVKAEKEVEETKPEKKEKIEVYAKHYAKPAIEAGIAFASFIGANHVSGVRLAAAQTAYAITNDKFKDYKEKVKEIVGDKEEKEVTHEMHKDEVQNAVDNTTPDRIPQAHGGRQLCYDVFTDRVFYSDRSTIERAVNKLNARMNVDGFVTLNDFYDEIGLDEIRVGSNFVFTYEGTGLIDVDYDATLLNNGEPAITIDFCNGPEYRENNMY